uniref:HAT C-terminal dimerisation domain-containing protein n=1 Tax=Lactuca sativa TaxID=4236 RepID=A0A9R1VWU4_LACSA|nr:hypothetical protein LSAT_V11C400218220 [Lactuca sativa]
MNNELQTYLNENIVIYKKDFSILSWWNVNTNTFLIVSRMTKDYYFFFCHSVTSVSAFSTSDIFVNEYQTSLSTLILKALLCIQDWVRKSKNMIVDDTGDILTEDDLAFEIAIALNILDDKGMKKRPMEVRL